MLELREYQRAALNAVYEYWEGGGGNPLVSLPTGSGKSFVIAALCQELLKQWPTFRVIMCTHVKELIKQNHDELLRLWPEAPVGVYSAGLKRRDVNAQLLFCGIQSVWRKADKLGGFDLILVDEAHLISRKASSMYRMFIDDLKAETPDLRIFGCTATPFRLDTGMLHKGEDALFDEIVYEASLLDLIKDGFLCKAISKATATQLDVTGVGKRGGEYIPHELEIAIDQDWITKAACKEIVHFGRGRKAWLAFCTGVKHARHVRDELCDLGVDAEVVVGVTRRDERDEIIARFRRGEITCLVSVGVLGTGFNVPAVDLIAMLRPTMSAGLYLQQAGRGLRVADGKKNCLVLDFARNCQRHGPLDTVTSRRVMKGEGPAPTKVCPQCKSEVPIAVMECPDCGYVWEPAERKVTHDATADAVTPILSGGIVPVWVVVGQIAFHKHVKAGTTLVPNIPTLRVEYFSPSMMNVYKEWVPLQHTGYARARAERWWIESGGARPVPATIDEALTRTGELRMPSQIQVRPKDRYFDILKRDFTFSEPVAPAALKVSNIIPFRRRL